MDISILIPARNEIWLSRTVEDILSNIEANTEIIVVLDGQWADPGIQQHERVTVVYLNKDIGQRAATNLAAKLARGKYIIKTDAHCAFDKGFDRKMLEAYASLPDGDVVTMVPTMRNLHVFNWVCKKCGNKWYQGPTPEHCCKDKTGDVRNEKCDSTEFEKDVVWNAKSNPQSNAYTFDRNLKFRYHREWETKPENRKARMHESMSLQGSFFMCTKAKYFELDLCEEEFGSWGQQGVEVACKTWLSGGRVVVNKNTWYGHLFRTQGGDFTFPYPQSNSQIDHARDYSRYLFQQNNWPKAIHKFEWLLERFGPLLHWDGSDNAKKGLIYYTDSRVGETLMRNVQASIIAGAKHAGISGKDIISVSLQPVKFGQNIVLPLERGYLTMAKQILAGLEASKAEIIFFCEHDVLYHPTHFEFVPGRKDRYYYNTNVWKVRAEDGFAVHVDDMRQLSGLCGYRDTLVNHFKERVRRIEAEGFSRKMGFEPGTHNRKERIDTLKSERWNSPYPNIDIRHDKNLTDSRWKPEQFRNQKHTIGWTESDVSKIKGWDNLVI